ncbi:GntR family transcriptional regulator [Roseivivax isoporae]|uniref:GntR family transcriptional regulator n=1 Tax=Roseivivax isoporae LMG 25204 TaxID=1449351 RepID=X7F874_9RHOB|nr:GntR family transcriptional regulator [Roseivivax isoporae]ETX28990.1 GntR family transcriptional regulator [Roseivivax isoporae LMG 25204]
MNVQTKGVPALRRTSLHQELADKVRELIVSGELPQGTKVPERELCEMFGVSRTPLREALKVLALDRLVVLEPNRGAWVSRITVADLEEVFPVMGALEALSGELACAKITDAELAAIRVLHEEMVGHFEARRLAEYFDLNQRIHEAILAAARNETLTVQYRSLATQVRRARFVANMTDARWQQATDEHAEIMATLEARDGPGLAAILRRHLQNKLETVREWLIANGQAG